MNPLALFEISRTGFERANPRRLVGVALLVLAATLVAWLPRLNSDSNSMTVFERWSFDWPHAWRLPGRNAEVVIVEMDEPSFRALGQHPAQLWARDLHAQFLQKLTRDGAGLVVFDVFFGDPGPPAGDELLAAAIRGHGKVAIAADLSDLPRSGVAGWSPMFPREPMRSAAAGVGLATPRREADGVVRRHFLELERVESLPWVAARLAGAAALAGWNRSAERWMNYHGPPRQSLRHMSYAQALGQGTNFFRGKQVFIGGAPPIKWPGERADTFRIPYTALDNEQANGAELVAMQFLNLVRGDAWVRISPWWELVLLGAWGLLATATLMARTVRLRVLAMAAVAASVWGAAWALPACGHVWFSWVLPLFIQVPVVFIAMAWERRQMVEEDGSPAVNRAAPGSAMVVAHNGTGRMPAIGFGTETPQVADHTLLRKVGTGAYGEVWVARNAVGILHAVKIIRRGAFESAAPFEREFRGITRFMPISRSHPGFVHVLQAGPEEVNNYFYYVMELADNAGPAESNLVERYQPTTLSSHLQAKKRLSATECLQLGLQMTDALSYLHQAQLIHRDIKPSNIIFVTGAPKLADIGLVTRMADNPREVSFLGTRGYLAPEGPGTPAADLYSLGKVLYEAYTGLDREQFPSLPTSLLESPSPILAELNQTVLKACEVDPRQRYQSAAEFHRKLGSLQARLAGD